MKNKNAHEYYAQGVQKEALFLPFFEKTAKQAVPNTFSHPDCTVGLGFAPSQSLSTAYDSESRAQTCVRHYRRSGIAPYPEGWYSVRQSIAHFSLLSVIIYWRSAHSPYSHSSRTVRSCFKSFMYALGTTPFCSISCSFP